jgi:rhodanese-related sulfurtransferase
MNERKMPKSLSPEEAWALLQKDSQAIMLDIRSTMEYLFVGHPKGAVHLSWIDEPNWEINPHFVTETRQILLGGSVEGDAVHSVPVILICRSGKRSLEAGELLLSEGFENVYHITEGFEGERDHEYHRSSTGGWRFRGLPWEQC